MLRYRTISEYELNGVKHITIEALNERDERVWVKTIPKDNIKSVIVANILDRPEDVNWKIKQSHVEEIKPSFDKQNYQPALSAGSISVTSGTIAFLKEHNSQVPIFPLDPLNSKNLVTDCVTSGNFNTGGTFTVSVNAPTWLGYAITSGTITQI